MDARVKPAHDGSFVVHRARDTAKSGAKKPYRLL
jgi:hypothetical protein